VGKSLREDRTSYGVVDLVQKEVLAFKDKHAAGGGKYRRKNGKVGSTV